jgi:hypothetical protein
MLGTHTQELCPLIDIKVITDMLVDPG